MAFTSDDFIRTMRELGITKEVVVDKPLLEQGIDSIDLPRIAVAIEKTHNVDLTDAKCENLRTIELFVAYVNAKAK